MGNYKHLIPKNKFDNSTIEKLKELSDEEIESILPELLKWIQDINWPVANEILPVLALHQEKLAIYILKVLNGKDEIWKYWIIEKLLPLFIDKNLIPLIPTIEKIAETPTSTEYFEDVNEVAKEFLKMRLGEDKNTISVIENGFPVVEKKDRDRFMKMTPAIQEIVDRVNKK